MTRSNAGLIPGQGIAAISSTDYLCHLISLLVVQPLYGDLVYRWDQTIVELF